MLFIWGWDGDGRSLEVQLPDYCPVLVRAHFCEGVVFTAEFGTFSPCPTMKFPYLSLDWILFIQGE